MSELTIRVATEKDAGTLLKFIKELAIYEKAEHEVLATEQTIKSSMFSDDSNVHALICELDGVAIGSAIYFYNYSTWLAKPGLYLEDLYISENYRGSSIGTQMMVQLAKIANELDCGRMEWTVLDWNVKAISFYNSIGADILDNWRIVRMGKDSIYKLSVSNNTTLN